MWNGSIQSFQQKPVSSTPNIKTQPTETCLKEGEERGGRGISTSDIKLRAQLTRCNGLWESSPPIGQTNHQTYTPVYLRHPPSYSQGIVFDTAGCASSCMIKMTRVTGILRIPQLALLDTCGCKNLFHFDQRKNSNFCTLNTLLRCVTWGNKCYR